MTRTVLIFATAALALGACQKQAANKPATAAEIAAGQAIAQAKAGAAGAAPMTGISQISTSGTPKGYSLRLPSPHIEAQGRSLTVSLPFRPSDGLTWTVGAGGAPWTLSSSKIEPKAGPEGTDLAVFTFQAGAAGSGNLAFQLDPASGASKAPQDHVMTYQATVIAP